MGTFAAALPPAASGVGADAVAPAGGAVGLQRHALVWLRPAAWERLASPAPGHGAAASPPPGAGDAAAAEVRACIAAWAARGWPLVATRQDAAAPGRVALGLPAPARWGRRRIALEAAAHDIARRGRFGAPESVERLMPGGARADWRRIAGGLRALGVAAGVYGSYGWQALTGLDYLHAGSDVDLCLPVRDAAQADRVAALLDAAPTDGALPRIDGELVLPCGAAVAWREWRRWRAQGMAGAVLVKRPRGAAMARGGGWLSAAGAA